MILNSRMDGLAYVVCVLVLRFALHLRSVSYQFIENFQVQHANATKVKNTCYPLINPLFHYLALNSIPFPNFPLVSLES